MKEKSTTTLKEVARAAGVSIGTVSNYLRDPEKVRGNNRLLIESAIQDLSFTPNVNARILATGKTKLIALYILSEKSISPTTWLHQLPIIQSIHDYLSLNGYSLQMCIVYETDPSVFISNVRQSVESKAVDGLLILSVWELPEELILYLLDRGFPFVTLDNTVHSHSVSSVYFDNSALLEELVDLLYDMGHTRIGFINVTTKQQDMHYRYLGFCKGLQKHGLQMRKTDVLYGDFSIESGYACMMRAQRQGSDLTAIIGGNDNMAVGALKALCELGISVPKDFSLIGIDNSIAAHACVPMLQTAQFYAEEMGEAAARLLLNMLEGRDHPPSRSINIGYQIIRGGTIARAPADR